ncbi:hypothetical protein BDZ89DRAFT_396230 [Hymenopellis radicata]|nr:hypothetical protein BDZ89DRAFT_396230 [Hymenopellis radicata]
MAQRFPRLPLADHKSIHIHRRLQHARRRSPSLSPKIHSWGTRRLQVCPILSRCLRSYVFITIIQIARFFNLLALVLSAARSSDMR